MSFIAECTFCQRKVRVPSGADGLSVPCPRCGNSFTLAGDSRRASAPPVMIQTGSKTRKQAQAPLAAMASPPTPALLAPKENLHQGDEPVSVEYVQQALHTNPLEPVLDFGPDGPEGQGPPPAAQRANYFGIASFFLGSMALVLAQVPVLAWLAIPLSCAGLVGGIIGFLVQGDLRKSGLVFAAAGTLVSLSVLVILAFVPDLLDIDPRKTNGTVAPDPNKQVVLQAGTHATPREAGGSEWVDASKASLQHGVVRLRVTAVAIKPPELKNRKEEDDAQDKRLVIGLRLINAQGTSPIPYESWNAARNAPRLQDNLGRSYRLVTLPAGQEVVGQVRKALLLAGKPVNDVLVFEVPAENVEFLRLELPAAAFDRTGTLHLQIPRSMIDER